MSHNVTDHHRVIGVFLAFTCCVMLESIKLYNKFELLTSRVMLFSMLKLASHRCKGYYTSIMLHFLTDSTVSFSLMRQSSFILSNMTIITQPPYSYTAVWLAREPSTYMLLADLHIIEQLWTNRNQQKTLYSICWWHASTSKTEL